MGCDIHRTAKEVAEDFHAYGVAENGGPDNVRSVFWFDN